MSSHCRFWTPKLQNHINNDGKLWNHNSPILLLMTCKPYGIVWAGTGYPEFDDWSLIIIVPNVTNSHITLQALHIIYSHFGGYSWVYRIFMHTQKSKRIILLAHIFPLEWVYTVYKPTYNWGPWPCIRLLLIYCTHHILIHHRVMNEFPYDMELWMNIWRFWNAHRTLILKVFKL